jgi:hypothetical protein
MRAAMQSIQNARWANREKCEKRVRDIDKCMMTVNEVCVVEEVVYKKDRARTGFATRSSGLVFETMLSEMNDDRRDAKQKRRNRGARSESAKCTSVTSPAWSGRRRNNTSPLGSGGRGFGFSRAGSK